MLRGCSASLLSRLAAQRAPLALALPLLAAYAPECARSLHVFVRRPSADYAKVQVGDGADAGDLKQAVIAALKLDAPPDCVRLLHEAAGGGRAPAPLDSRRALAEQQVREGDGVLVEVLAAPPAAVAPWPQGGGAPAAPLRAESSQPTHPPLPGLEQSARHTLFYRAVCAAAPVADPTGRTRLWRLCDPSDPAQPLTWPFLGARVLVERDFYARYLSEGKWLDNFSGAQRMAAVLGQPGIGKSAFGVWLLAQLLRSGRTVVYSRSFAKSGVAADVKHFVYHRGTAYKVRGSELGCIDSLLQDPAVVHLCDSIKPQGGDECHKVLITSPDPGVWRWFVEKEHAKPAYFPLFDYAELEALREAEFGAALAPETLRLRVSAWGLSPRAVISPNQQVVGTAVAKAMNGRSLEDLQRYMGEVRAPTGAAASDTSHALFTLQADRETLSEGDVTFRSEAVARRVVRHVASMSRDALIPALQRLLACSSTRTLAGTAFELAAIDVLGRGWRSEFSVRALFAPDPSSAAAAWAPWQELPASTSSVHSFDSLLELVSACEAGSLDLRRHSCRPKSSSTAAIDLIGPGLQLFQITVNRSAHELQVTSGRSSKEGLLALYLSLLPLLPERWAAREHHLDVCFVVPEGCARDWKAQRLVVHRTPSASGRGAKPGAPSAAAPEHAVSIVQCKGGVTGFSVGGRVVEVRQHVMELPREALSEWLALPQPQRDAINEALES